MSHANPSECSRFADHGTTSDGTSLVNSSPSPLPDRNAIFEILPAPQSAPKTCPGIPQELATNNTRYNHASRHISSIPAKKCVAISAECANGFGVEARKRITVNTQGVRDAGPRRALMLRQHDVSWGLIFALQARGGARKNSRSFDQRKTRCGFGAIKAPAKSPSFRNGSRPSIWSSRT